MNEICEKLEELYEIDSNILNWSYIGGNLPLSEDFIESHLHHFNYNDISKYQELSEDFILKHEGLNWFYILTSQPKISKEFIIKYKHKANLGGSCSWQSLSLNYKLSENFIRVFADKLDFNLLMKTPHICDHILDKFKVFI